MPPLPELSDDLWEHIAGLAAAPRIAYVNLEDGAPWDTRVSFLRLRGAWHASSAKRKDDDYYFYARLDPLPPPLDLEHPGMDRYQTTWRTHFAFHMRRTGTSGRCVLLRIPNLANEAHASSRWTTVGLLEDRTIPASTWHGVSKRFSRHYVHANVRFCTSILLEAGDVFPDLFFSITRNPFPTCVARKDGRGDDDYDYDCTVDYLDPGTAAASTRVNYFPPR